MNDLISAVSVEVPTDKLPKDWVSRLKWCKSRSLIESTSEIVLVNRYSIVLSNGNVTLSLKESDTADIVNEALVKVWELIKKRYTSFKVTIFLPNEQKVYEIISTGLVQDRVYLHKPFYIDDNCWYLTVSDKQCMIYTDLQSGYHITHKVALEVLKRVVRGFDPSLWEDQSE